MIKKTYSAWPLRCLVVLQMLGLILFGSCNHSSPDEPLKIATSANMQFAMDSLIKTFRETTGIACEKVVSSSGKLTAQIRRGAPYDIMVSADMKYPGYLFDQGIARTPPEIYGYGKLVLWTLNEDIPLSIETLHSPGITHIAVANPKNAPYGRAAIEVLKNHGMYSKVKHKLVYGESIAQTNQFIISGSAQIGFTAKSVVMSPKMKNKGRWMEPDQKNYPEIAQGMVIIDRKGADLEKQQQFYRFM